MEDTRYFGSFIKVIGCIRHDKGTNREEKAYFFVVEKMFWNDLIDSNYVSQISAQFEWFVIRS